MSARLLQQVLRIGTARAGLPSASLAPALDTLLPREGPQAAPEARLWLSLGAIDLWERSGFVAAEASAPMATAPAAPDLLAPCPARAEALLEMLLRGLHAAGLQRQWLALARRHGVRVPARLLPKLLDLATHQAALRAPLLPVLDERGRWLARLRPEWAWVAQAHAGTGPLWDTGTLEQRVAALRDWRRRDPAAARAALEAAWPGEPPEHRAALLPALAPGLGPADEAFLEAALDDRRKEVRAGAQRLLALLPGSQLSRRLLERLLPLLRLERRLLGAARLHLELPAVCDAAMRRDGIGAHVHAGLGEKAGWVVDMLAAVDPQVWTERFGRGPRACLALAGGGEFAGVLVRGWALACMRHAAGDAPQAASPGVLAWLRDLALWWIDAGPALRASVPDDLFEIAGARLAAHAADAFDALLDAFPPRWYADAQLARLLQRLADRPDGAWPAAPSRIALPRLEAALPALSTVGDPWQFRQLLSSLALVLDPATALAFEAAWRDAIPTEAERRDVQWCAAFGQFFDLVRLRHEMTLSFQEPACPLPLPSCASMPSTNTRARSTR